MRFKTWINKINESITFSVEDKEKDIDTVGDVVWFIIGKIDELEHLSSFFNKFYKMSNGEPMHPMQFLTPDGIDDDLQEGTINFYLSKELENNPELEKKIITALTYHIKEAGANILNIYKEKSSSTGWREIGVDIDKVWRIKISLTKTDTSPPVLNISNENAVMLLRALGVDDSYAGEITARELLWKANELKNNEGKINSLVRGQSQEDEELKQHILGRGEFPQRGIITKPQILRYLNSLIELCNWAIKNNYTNIEWS